MHVSVLGKLASLLAFLMYLRLYEFPIICLAIGNFGFLILHCLSQSGFLILQTNKTSNLTRHLKVKHPLEYDNMMGEIEESQNAAHSSRNDLQTMLLNCGPSSSVCRSTSTSSRSFVQNHSPCSDTPNKNMVNEHLAFLCFLNSLTKFFI